MDLFIARQPIFDEKLKAVAYDLRFRHSVESSFYVPSPSEAAASVVSTSTWVMDLEQIGQGKPVHIVVSREFLLQDYASLLPQQSVRLEIQDIIEPLPEVLEICEKLKAGGYSLVMDIPADATSGNPLIKLVEMVKLDFSRLTAEARRRVAGMLASSTTLLAENISDKQEFEEALELGCKLFHGTYFSRPNIISAKDVPGFKLNYLKILREVLGDEMDFGRVESTLKLELSLTYKLLRLVNSAQFAPRQEIGSIRQALVMLGEQQFKKWIGLVALTGMGRDKPEEIVMQALIRARACEKIAPLAGMEDQAQELFLMGLFSLIDTILDRPMDEILEQIPLPAKAREALLGAEGPCRDLLDCVINWETGEWDEIQRLSSKLNLNEDKLPCLIGDAWIWCSRMFGALKPVAA